MNDKQPQQPQLCLMCSRREPRVGHDTCLRCAPAADAIDARVRVADLRRTVTSAGQEAFQRCGEIAGLIPGSE